MTPYFRSGFWVIQKYQAFQSAHAVYVMILSGTYVPAWCLVESPQSVSRLDKEVLLRTKYTSKFRLKMSPKLTQVQTN